MWHSMHRLRAWSMLLIAVMLLVTVAFLSIAAGAQTAPEARALWVTRGDLTSKSNIDFMINLSKAMGANMLIVQVTASGDTLIDSDYLPRSRNVAPDFDALAYIVERGHQEGMQVHAWINAMVLGGFSQRPQDPRHVVNAHPELITYDTSGRSLTELIGVLPDRIPSDLPGLMLEPTLPAVRSLIANHAAEIARKYDVDGVHLDYIRYAGRNYGYNPASREAFRALHGYDPLAFAPPNAARFAAEHGVQLRAQLERLWDDYRRDAVTQTVRDVYAAVTREKPWVVVSAAVFANSNDAYQYRFQDWTMWLREGLIDLALPMAYSTNRNLVREQIRVASEAARAGGRQVLAGIGAYNIKDDRALFTAILADMRSLGVAGFSLFSYQSIIGDLNTFLMIRSLFGEGEIPPVPTMPWKPTRP